MTSLPKALEPWEPELRHFAANLAPGLGALCSRLREVLGPLRTGTTQPSDEPVGYGSLGRRGPWERLLASEWALQLEHPDEFARRASASEQLFLQLERASPAATAEAWLFLDCGPAQLGAPRLAHLAALVAFTRRAREAGLVLRWAPVREHGRTENEGLGRDAVARWLSARNGIPTHEADVAAWRPRLPDTPGLGRDTWLVGGADACAFARQQGWSTVTVVEGEGGLRVEVSPHGLRARVLSLALPPVAEQVRLVRDPFPSPQPAPPPARRRNARTEAVALHRQTELAFSYDGHRLLARTDDGSVTSLPIPNTQRATMGWPRTARLPNGAQLVASFWDSKRRMGLVVSREKDTWLAAWDGALTYRLDTRPRRAAPDHALWRSASAPSRGWQEQDLWLSPGDTPVYAKAIASGPTSVALLQAPGNAHAVDVHAPGAPIGHYTRTLVTVGEVFDRAWLMQGSGRLFVAYQQASGVKLCTWNLSKPSQPIVHQLPAVSDAQLGGATVAGLVNHGEVPALILVAPGGQAVHRLARIGAEWVSATLFRARSAVLTLAVSNPGARLAWRDAQGEVGVYSLERQQVLLRVHVKNAAEPVP